MADCNKFIYILMTALYARLAFSDSIDPSVPERFAADSCAQNEDDIIRYGLSYHNCTKTCKALKECKAVSVWPKMSMCRLHTQTSTLTDKPGCVYTSKSDWDEKTLLGCTDTSCPDMYSCHSKAGHIVCKIEGCMPRSLENGYVLGAQSHLGAKRVYACNREYILSGNDSVVCMEDGWRGGKPSCNEYLVSGPNGVPDDHLSASSVWDSHWHGMSSYFSPKFSRLNTEWTDFDGTGGWIALDLNQNQYIQVRFASIKTVVGVALRGRSHPIVSDYITLFKVWHSDTCSSWSVVMDEGGAEKEFVGNNDRDTTVIRFLPEEIQALCVRINPVAWHSNLSLRFDVIGRTPPSSG